MPKRNSSTKFLILMLFTLMLVFPACGFQDVVQENPIVGTWQYTLSYQGQEANFLLQLSKDNTFKSMVDGEMLGEGIYEFFKESGTLNLKPENGDPENVQVEISEDGDALLLEDFISNEKIIFKKTQ